MMRNVAAFWGKSRPKCCFQRVFAAFEKTFHEGFVDDGNWGGGFVVGGGEGAAAAKWECQGSEDSLALTRSHDAPDSSPMVGIGWPETKIIFAQLSVSGLLKAPGRSPALQASD